MSEEDVKQMIRELKTSISLEFESIHRRIDEFESRILIEIRSISRRINTVNCKLDAHKNREFRYHTPDGFDVKFP